MKVILLKDIAKLGKRGEVKEVADGFAINVLMKKGDALQATPSELSKWKAKEDAKNHKKELEVSAFAQLAAILKEKKITIENLKHDSTHLFAAITKDAIVDAIFASTKLSINPSQISIEKPMKTLGTHMFTLSQGGKEVDLTIELIGK